VLCPKKLTNNWNTYKDNYDILLLRTSAILPEAISSGGLTPPLIQACFSPPIEVGVISQLIYIVNKERSYAMPGILVVEDDENLNRGITFSLKKSGYEVFSAESVKKAKRIASDNNVDVTICDVNLPDGNGLEFVRWMRCNYNTYIICLTALDQEMDQVMGYEAGADDYITKPFSLSVLLLKIEAHFRRRQEKTEAGKMISGDIVFIAGEMKVLIKSREISLTKTELKMLTFFLQNPKQILSKTQILENVFDLEGDFVDENTIAVNIRRLREKIEDNPAAPVYIKNIRGLGYIWNQEVRQ